MISKHNNTTIKMVFLLHFFLHLENILMNFSLNGLNKRATKMNKIRKNIYIKTISAGSKITNIFLAITLYNPVIANNIMKNIDK